jgi:hypothetical protein
MAGEDQVAISPMYMDMYKAKILTLVTVKNN